MKCVADVVVYGDLKEREYVGLQGFAAIKRGRDFSRGRESIVYVLGSQT